MVDDGARGVELGRQKARPGLFELRYLDLGSAPLVRIVFETGLEAGRLQPPVGDVDTFFKGFLRGLHEADAAFAAEHSRQPLCDIEEPDSMREYCESYHGSIAAALRDRDRWQRETEDPARVFVTFRSCKAHRRDCPAVQREVSLADQRLTTLTPADTLHGGESVQWPRLLTFDQAVALNRMRCRVCCPDLPDQV